MNTLETNYSAEALAVAKIFVERSQYGLFGDPQLTLNELVEETDLSRQEIEDAIYELGGMVRQEFNDILPEHDLFVTFDEFWKQWNPSVDALRIAIDLVKDDQFSGDLPEISQRYDWEPRRLNPAVAYMMNRNLILYSRVIGSHPWVIPFIQKNSETRRFVRSRL